MSMKQLWLLGLLVACAGPAAALDTLTDAQRAYLAAHTFDMQMDAFRGVCARERGPRAMMDGAMATFAQRNPRYAAALADPPDDPEFIAGVERFDGEVRALMPRMRAQLEQGDLEAGCRRIAGEIAGMSFDELLRRAIEQEKSIHSGAK